MARTTFVSWFRWTSYKDYFRAAPHDAACERCAALHGASREHCAAPRVASCERYAALDVVSYQALLHRMVLQRMAQFYSDHPQLVQVLGQAALGVAMNRMAMRRR